ncbi:MAG: O-acetyl-ADP-ribose deacetylase [Verrucomicrobiae bacterium]|jgi:O-acetyl-ADP-ribose deacetylase (regulator of RNase III)|nr:O-acetyl-ADP-ribose deacetylase [Verrucomicrobiae bacterium]
MRERLELFKGDITTLDVSVIVNAANSSLLGGGGVDGAIHRAAGPELVWECRKLNGCPTGSAKLTGGHNLKAAHVIHTVGPIWRDGNHGEPDLLTKAYRSCFALIRQMGFGSAAFPSISTGAYRFPLEQASRIAIQEGLAALEENLVLRKLIFVCYDAATLEAYQARIEQLAPVPA